ncbi:hypothetical protein EDB83DRAFT_2316704 [Lactarius deliciosus]|nr:hypothetical protein EDB83DRAFT_2316704 [Lactarius deliciosus]
MSLPLHLHAFSPKLFPTPTPPDALRDRIRGHATPRHATLVRRRSFDASIKTAVDQNSLILMCPPSASPTSSGIFLEHGCGFGPVSTHARQGKHKPTGQIDLRGGARGGGAVRILRTAKQVPWVHHGAPRSAVPYNITREATRSARNGRPEMGPSLPAHLGGHPHPPRDALANPIREVGLLPPASEGGGEDWQPTSETISVQPGSSKTKHAASFFPEVVSVAARAPSAFRSVNGANGATTRLDSVEVPRGEEIAQRAHVWTITYVNERLVGGWPRERGPRLAVGTPSLIWGVTPGKCSSPLNETPVLGAPELYNCTPVLCGILFDVINANRCWEGARFNETPEVVPGPREHKASDVMAEAPEARKRSNTGPLLVAQNP